MWMVLYQVQAQKYLLLPCVKEVTVGQEGTLTVALLDANQNPPFWRKLTPKAYRNNRTCYGCNFWHGHGKYNECWRLYRHLQQYQGG